MEADPSRGDNSYLAGVVISLLGGFLLVARIPLLANVGTIPAVLLAVGLPALLGVALIGVGYVTAQGYVVQPEDAVRLVGWVLVGMTVFLLVGVWIIILDVVLGQPVPFGYLLTLNAVTLGGVAGAVIGLYDAQGREYTRKLERREKELEEQNDRLDEFVSIVSHDLRNPLNVAEGRLELVREDASSDHLDHVERALERMEALIADMLQLARQNESITEVETVDLAEVTRTCWRNVATAEADLVTGVDRQIQADYSRLEQLLENLFRNAVEHGGEDVRIRVGDVENGFFVEDDGPGISQDIREQVFEAGLTTNEDGTGFGLSIVRRVADAHDWKISVTESEGGGARFEITGVSSDTS